MEDEGIPIEKPKRQTGVMGLVRKRLPILEWAPLYDRTAAVADLVAGVTLGLTLVPQSIAYASLANLPVQYGLYSAYIGTILYVFLGTVKEVSIGPTSLMALFTLQLCRGLPIEFVVLTTFLSGCLVLAMGLLRLGFLVELISPSVTSGFTSGTAIIIVVSQLKGLLGLSFTAEDVADNLRLIARHWGAVRLPDVVLGASCCTVLLALRKLKDVPVSPKRVKLKKALWLVSIGRNALVVLAASTLAYVLHDPAAPLFKLSGRVEGGMPRVSWPPFRATLQNRTLGAADMARELGAGLLMLPLLMLLANIAIAMAFSQGGRVDATQEMLTLGLCNIVGSMLHAMPTCGAFTRSAVSHSSGVRTPAAGLYSGIITLLALMFLTKYFYFIPKACLSSVLICAVVFMIDVSMLRRLWRADRGELGVLALTLGVGVARSVELAAGAGALGSLALMLRRVMRPSVAGHTVKSPQGAVPVVRPSGALWYLNAELVARRVMAAAATCRPSAAATCRPQPVLLDCSQITLVDYSAALVLERLAEKLKLSNQRLVPFRACAGALGRLRAVPRLEPRALPAADVAAALRAIADERGDGEDAALLNDVV